jgi:hypothetical protein
MSTFPSLVRPSWAQYGGAKKDVQKEVPGPPAFFKPSDFVQAVRT